MADSPRIVIAGDVIDDIVVVPHAPIRPDTDTASTIASRAGGSPANTAAWLGSIGGSVDFVGLVGSADVERHSALLAAHGVRAHLAPHPSARTGTIVVIVDGELRAMLTERGANADFDPDAVPDSLLQGASALFLTGHSLAGRTEASAMRRLVSRARVAGLDVAVAPGSAGHIADIGVETFLTAFEGATVLLASLDEGRALSGVVEVAEVAEHLTRFAETVVLTLGGEGSFVAGHGVVAAVAAEVVDPTGAGDAFAAGFLDAWVVNRDAAAAAAAGAALAARAVTVVGGRP